MLRHLATCDDCRREYAELIRAEPLPRAPSSFDPAAFVERGYAARRPGAGGPWWRAWRPVWALPAAAVLAVAALVPYLRFAPSSDEVTGATTRGAEIELLAPAGDVVKVAEFRWASPVSAPRYRLEVTDSAGRLVYATDVAEEHARPPNDVLARLRAGERYAWKVVAFDAHGQPILTSKPRSFIVLPPRR